MPYRIFMTIKRGTMDDTAVCVFPWERPLLEEIHGGGAQVKTIEELSSMREATKIETIKMKNPETQLAPGLKQQLIAMTKVDREHDPFNNLDEEFGRLCDKYGMHPAVKLPVAEKVFGSPANFRAIVKAYRGDTPPKDDPLNPQIDLDEQDKAPADMSRDELKAALDAKGIAYAKNAPDEKLIELLTDELAQAA